jgi:hypothetical protein
MVPDTFFYSQAKEGTIMKTIRTLLSISLLLAMTSPAVFADDLPKKEPALKDQESSFKIKDFKSDCLKDLSKEATAAGDFGNVSFGPTVGVKALTYDLASKRAAFNSGVGAGFSMRLYSDVKFYSADGNVTERYGINRIRKKCRGETFDGSWMEPDNQKVIPWISISPMVYASKTERVDEVVIQPALTVGFLGELINVGTGFNLSGPDKGHVFLILTLGYGFKF